MEIAYYICDSCGGAFGSNFTRDVVTKCECGENALRRPRSEFLKWKLDHSQISLAEYKKRMHIN